jgi:hypothetical protein
MLLQICNYWQNCVKGTAIPCKLRYIYVASQRTMAPISIPLWPNVGVGALLLLENFAGLADLSGPVNLCLMR